MRLINADELMELYDGCDGLSVPIAVVQQNIKDATTIDAEPVRCGHWILEREPNGKPYCFHCSVCDDDFHHIGIKSATDYCPNCGAKMDGELNE